MNEDLIKTLQGFRHDYGLVVDLYRQLFDGQFWTLIKQPVVPIQQMLFLTYPTPDGTRELPVFTSPDRALISQLQSDSNEAVCVQLEGVDLWPRTTDIVKTGECEVAVDPGEQHGIRLTTEMILGMVNEYGTRHTET